VDIYKDYTMSMGICKLTAHIDIKLYKYVLMLPYIDWRCIFNKFWSYNQIWCRKRGKYKTGQG